MIIKIILTVMLCIPMACLQIYLITDALQDIKKKPIEKKSRTEKNYGNLRIAK